MDINTESYLSKFKLTKVQFEFQELGFQLEQIFGKSVWPLFYAEGNEDKYMRQLLKEWDKRKAGYLRYLLKEVKK